MAIEKVHVNKLPAGLKSIYAKAEDLIRKNNNYAYGITLLNDLVKAVPGFAEARELLRYAEKQNADSVLYQTGKRSIHICLIIQNHLINRDQGQVCLDQSSCIADSIVYYFS